MDKDIRKINNIIVDIFSLVELLEEESVKGSSFENLSLKEVHTLVAVGSGRPKTMTNVASTLGISVSTLTTAINKLVKKGYVDRFRDERDKRIVRISLTEQGLIVLNKHEQYHEQVVGEALRRLSKNERNRLERVLTEIEHFLMLKAAGSERRTHLMMEPMTIGTHNLPVPIVQAGMSIGIAGEKLAAAVAINGGLGLIALTDIGFEEPDFDKNPVEANKRAIRRKVKAARQSVEAADGKGLIGVNIIWNREHAEEYLETAIKSGAQVVVTNAGMPKNLPRYCTDKKVALVPTVSTKRAANAIAEAWSRNYNRMPDAFILQSPTAAGLLGYRDDQLDSAIKEWQLTISELRGVVNKIGNCPLIVGGGIVSKADADRVYRCGADGFLLGSRFVTTEECDAPEEYKKLYLECKDEDIVTVNSPMNGVVRVMRNKFSANLVETGRREYDIFKAVRDGVRGDYENGLIFCCRNPERLQKIDTVADVFDEFTK
ncbi:MAG: nitronate monooxygenase [Bacillota bacterium]|nr:nitronate monooxygenase [Bacillota bacterium]